MKNYLLLCGLFCLLSTNVAYSKAIIHDSDGCDLSSFFSRPNSIYAIRYPHRLVESIEIPEGCELKFVGGSLAGEIAFNRTKLSGDVKLQGSKITGTVQNNEFDASWLCYRDGKTDDAENINQILKVCPKVYFPKGVYRMKTAYQPADLEKELWNSVECHIGINKSGIILRGEDGTIFETDEVLGMITVYSQPNRIDKSIGNIKISKIKFITHNDGKEFHEFTHVIKLIGVNGVVIEGCEINDFWGDGICLSHYGDDPITGERSRNQNVKILNNIIVGGTHRSNRNGISVISGKNIIIRENYIRRTSRIDMPGGIDIEPNNSVYTIDNIRIEKNQIEDLHRGAINIFVPQGGQAHQIRVTNNNITKCAYGIYIIIRSNDTTNDFVISGNRTDVFTNPYYFTGGGVSSDWTFRNNTFRKGTKETIPGNIKVKNLVVNNKKIY